MFFVKEAKAEVTKIITPHLIISACMGSLTGKKVIDKIPREKEKPSTKWKSPMKKKQRSGISGGLVHRKPPHWAPQGSVIT